MDAADHGRRAMLLVVAALPPVAVTQGSPWMALGLAGFAVWLLFLAITGSRCSAKAPAVAGA